MVICTRNDYSNRNACIKVLISVLIVIGIICAIFAICSCRWFAFEQDEFNGDNHLSQDWTFLPERDLDTTVSIGLFRYQTVSIDVTNNDDEFSNNTTPSAYIETKKDVYVSINNDRCLSYPGFWVGIDHQWKFTAQLCIMFGIIIAFVSFCVIIVGADRLWICTFLLLATGLQSATIISSLSWCDQYWNCPWLFGALVNLIAACLFLSCWMLAVWGLTEPEINNTGNVSTNINMKTDQQQNSKRRQKNGDQDTKIESTDPGDSLPSSVIISKRDKLDERNEEISCIAAEGLFEARDLERGSKAIHLYHPSDHFPYIRKMNDFESCRSDNDDKRSMKDEELYYDKSFDDDVKATMRRISQSNQTFLDLDAKLKERLEKAARNVHPL